MDFQEFIKEDTKTKVFQDEEDLEQDGHLNNTQVEYQEEKWQFLKNNEDSHFLPFAGDEDTLGRSILIFRGTDTHHFDFGPELRAGERGY